MNSIKSNIQDLKQTKKFCYKDIRKDLKKAVPYMKKSWGKQRDAFDKKTNFIYRAKDFDDLINEHRKRPFDDLNYAVRRYYNFISSDTIEKIICSYNVCERERKKWHKTIDLYIYGEPFDLKVSSYPRAFDYKKEDFANDRSYRNALILWLYANQSSQGRYHESNRLFVLCKKGSGKDSFENNLLKMDFDNIHKRIENYLLYTQDRLRNGLFPFNTVRLPNDKIVCSDVILLNA